ncbi:MAG: radical SAM protein, partial [Candidatus Zixiibacteriota bacterium]
VYCHYGFTDVHTMDLSKYISDIPKPKDVERALEDWLERDKNINYITFSGNGEPTLHPDFDEIVDRVKKIRDKYVPGVQVAVLSNSTGLVLPQVKPALSKLDKVFMKLDCGTSRMFSRINRPAKNMRYEDVVGNLKSLDGIIIQSVFVGGNTTNTDPDEVKQWIEKIEKINPLRVQIYSLDRPSPSVDFKKVDRDILSGIAEETKKLTGIEVEVF